MKKKKKEPETYFGKFWKYLWHDDSIGSYVLNFIVAFVVIKYIFFPTLGFILNNDYPIVAIVSGSMEHKITNGKVCSSHILDIDNQRLNFEKWWEFCGNYYEKNYNITSEQFDDFKYSNGLNIGDVMILYGKDIEDIEVGEVLVFIPEDRNFYETKGPVIHRVMRIYEEDREMYFQTKGDHNPQSFVNFERKIPKEDVIGVGVIRIPYIGYAKLMLNNIFTLF